jgi:hypothetical protein
MTEMIFPAPTGITSFVSLLSYIQTYVPLAQMLGIMFAVITYFVSKKLTDDNMDSLTASSYILSITYIFFYLIGLLGTQWLWGGIVAFAAIQVAKRFVTDY